jgi:hypothetical protein
MFARAGKRYCPTGNAWGIVCQWRMYRAPTKIAMTRLKCFHRTAMAIYGIQCYIKLAGALFFVFVLAAEVRSHAFPLHFTIGTLSK